MKIRLAISFALAFLAFVFISQNTETVQVEFFTLSVEISLVLLVFIILACGVIMGWLLNSYMRFVRQRKKQQTTADAAVSENAALNSSQVNGDAKNDE